MATRKNHRQLKKEIKKYKAALIMAPLYHAELETDPAKKDKWITISEHMAMNQVDLDKAVSLIQSNERDLLDALYESLIEESAE